MAFYGKKCTRFCFCFFAQVYCWHDECRCEWNWCDGGFCLPKRRKPTVGTMVYQDRGECIKVVFENDLWLPVPQSCIRTRRWCGHGVSNDLFQLWTPRRKRQVQRPHQVWYDRRYYSWGRTQFLSYDCEFRRTPMGLDGWGLKFFCADYCRAGFWKGSPRCNTRNGSLSLRRYGSAKHSAVYVRRSRFYCTDYGQSWERISTWAKCVQQTSNRPKHS